MDGSRLLLMGDLPSADAYLALLAADLATWRLDCVAEVAYLSPLWASWVGLAIPEGGAICSLPFAQWRTYVHPDDWPQVRAGIIALLKGEIPRYAARYRFAALSEPTKRQWVWLEDRGQVTERDLASGKAITAIGVCRNITSEMHHTVWEVRLAKGLLHAPIATIIADAHDRVIWWNRASEALFGRQSFAEVFVGALTQPVARGDADVQEAGVPLLVTYTREDGTTHYLEAYRAPFASQVTGEQFVVYSFHDITDRIALEQQLRHLALTDPLTGLPNRRAFMERAGALFARVHRAGGKERAALALIDLDWFKRINDTMGHAAGDAVLRQFARLLHQTYRQMDALGRLGGEEFGVMLPLLHEDEEPWRPFERLLEGVRRLAVPVDGSVIRFTCSIGVTEVALSDRSLDDLFARADQALYRAKEEGRNRLIWIAPQEA